MEEHEDADRLKESNEEYMKISKSLDPLISSLTNFHSEEQLMSSIDRMYEYLDIDASGSITFEEMKSGLEKLAMEPAIRFTHDDYEEFTRSCTFTDEEGGITKAGFMECILLEMKAYAFRNVSHQLDQAHKYEKEKDACDYLTSKVLLREICLLSSKISSEIAKPEERDLAAKHVKLQGSEREACSEDGLVQNGRQRPWWCKTIFDQLVLMNKTLERLEGQNVDIQSRLDQQNHDISRRFQCLEGKSPNESTTRQEMSVERRGILQIMLVGVENLLRSADRPVNLFVILSFGNQRRESSVKSASSSTSLSVSWNESFLFDVFNDDADPIVLTLCNWDSAGQHEVMGHIKINPSDISREGPVTRESHYLVHRNKTLVGQNLKASTVTVQIEVQSMQAEDEEKNSDAFAGRESAHGRNPNASYIKTVPMLRVITPRVVEDARSDNKHSEAHYVEAAESIFSVQSDLVFEFSPSGEKDTGSVSNTLGRDENVTSESTRSTVRALGVASPSGEPSEGSGDRVHASNMADMNRFMHSGKAQHSEGALLAPRGHRKAFSEGASLESRKHSRTSEGHNVGALPPPALSGSPRAVATLENTSQDALIMLRGRRMSRQEKVSGWLL